MDEDDFPKLIVALHAELQPEIEELCAQRLHIKVNTGDYVSQHLLPDQQRFLMSMMTGGTTASATTADASDVASWMAEACDYGKLHDIKAVFDHCNVAQDLLRKKDAQQVSKPAVAQGVHGGGAVGVSLGGRAHSAPMSSTSKLTQMSLGLFDSGFRGSGGGGTTTSASKAPHHLSGMNEKMFVARVAPIMCPTFPRSVASWYNSIDCNSAGCVTWNKFAKYLQTYYEAARQSVQRLATLSQQVRYEEIPKGHQQKGVPYRALQVQDSRTSFYILCSDGCVRDVSKASMKVVEVVHYPDPEDPFPIDIKYSVDRNQLYVALPSGIVFVYDTSGHLTRQGNITRAFRINDQQPYNERGWSTDGGIAVMPKMAKFDPIHMELPDTGARLKEIPAAIVTNCDVFPLSYHSRCRCGASSAGSCVCAIKRVARGQLTAVDPYQESHGSKDQLFFAGFEHGHVALYKPPAVCPVVHAPRKAAMVAQPFQARATCLRYCDTFSDLRGLLTSSSEGHLALVDVETADVVVTFRDNKENVFLSDGGGWIGGCRPVTTFDVSEQLPVIASCGHMRGVSLWSASMRRKLATFQDHRGPVQSICFNQSTFHIMSIGADRTIRIWDIRTMKSIQVIMDRDRVDNQPFGVLSYDASCDRVVAWTGAPYVFPLVDDHLASRTATDLSPVTCMLVVEDELRRRLVVGSGSTLSVWELHTGELELVLETGAHISALALDVVGKKVFVAIGEDILGQYVVGSQVLSSRTRIALGDGGQQIRCVAHVRKHAARRALRVPRTNSGLVVNIPSFIVIGGRCGLVGIFSDRVGGMTAAPTHSVSLGHALETHSGRPEDEVEGSSSLVGDVTALRCTHNLYGDFIIAATSRGVVAMLSAEQDGLVLQKIEQHKSMLCQMSATTSAQQHITDVVAAPPKALGGTTVTTTRSASAPLVKTAFLWKRAVSAARKEQPLHAQSFTQFRYTAQEQMQIHVEDIAPLEPWLGRSNPPSTADASLTSSSCGESNDADDVDSIFFAVANANGDCKILVASSKLSMEEQKTFRTIACFPATTSDGCGCQIISSGASLWIGDDGGTLSEYFCDFGAKCDVRNGPKYFTQMQIQLVHVTKFTCGIGALGFDDRKTVLTLGLENGRCCALRVSDHQLLWGMSLDVEQKTSELMLKHRFQFCFRSLEPASVATAPHRKFQGIAKAVTRMMALRPQVNPLPEIPESVVTSEANRDAFLHIVMRNAPKHLRVGVLNNGEGEGDDEDEGPPSKTDALRYRDRTSDAHRSCFSRLQLNDVSALLGQQTKPSRSSTSATSMQHSAIKKRAS